MKRAIYLLIAVFVLASAVYATDFKLSGVQWGVSKQHQDQELFDCCVQGYLTNTSKDTYKLVLIKYGIYDIKDDARVRVQWAWTEEFYPGEKWKFYTDQPIKVDGYIPVWKQYYYKLLSVEGWKAEVKG